MAIRISIVAEARALGLPDVSYVISLAAGRSNRSKKPVAKIRLRSGRPSDPIYKEGVTVHFIRRLQPKPVKKVEREPRRRSKLTVTSPT